MKVHRLEIATRPPLPDARGLADGRDRARLLGHPRRLAFARATCIASRPICPRQTRRRVLHEFVDPIAQQGALGRLEDGPFGVAVTVAYKPGVTDPVGKSARVCVEDTLGHSSWRPTPRCTRPRCTCWTVSTSRRPGASRRSFWRTP